MSSRTEPITPEEMDGSTEKVHAQLNSTNLYNAMIYPFTRMVIKGSIWYQGILLMLIQQYYLLLFQVKVMLVTIAISTIAHFRK